MFMKVLLINSDYKYTPVIISLYKELDYDISKLLRVIYVGSQDSHRVFPRDLVNYLHRFISAAVVLTHYQNHIAPDGHIKTVEMSKLDRFKVLGLDRLKIDKLVKKYITNKP